MATSRWKFETIMKVDNNMNGVELWIIKNM